MATTCKFDYVDRLAFIAEWYDFEGGNLKQFYLNFYPYDSSVELWEKSRNRIFLRRALCEGISIDDMFVGNTVRVYGRQLNIIEYADQKTRKLIAKTTERTFALFKPKVMNNFGTILHIILSKGFKLVRAKMCELTRKEASEFYEAKKADAFMAFLVEHIVSGPVFAAEIVGENAIEKWKQLMGPTDPSQARKEAPESLRALYGIELASNGFHGPDTEEQVTKESNFFFPKPTDNRRPPKTTAKFKYSTCCIIKPHVIEAGYLGDIVVELSNSEFSITAMEMFYLSNANADEFLEVYKGVVTDFNSLMLSFIDGPCVALEIGSKREGMDVHGEFRKFCGPSDPDVARQIRPGTLRARFGVDKYKNAVHCTDLPEDTELELEYFFKLLES